MIDHDEWKLQVTTQLATLIQQTTDVVDQVKRQNGNVARLTERMNAMEKHPGTCPLNEEVDALKLAMAAQTATDAARTTAASKVQSWVQPILMLLMGALVTLAVQRMQPVAVVHNETPGVARTAPGR